MKITGHWTRRTSLITSYVCANIFPLIPCVHLSICWKNCQMSLRSIKGRQYLCSLSGVGMMMRRYSTTIVRVTEGRLTAIYIKGYPSPRVHYQEDRSSVYIFWLRQSKSGVRSQIYRTYWADRAAAMIYETKRMSSRARPLYNSTTSLWSVITQRHRIILW